MQDKILLGFLMNGRKTGYEVKKLMEGSTSFFFNTSLGSIYPAFRKLEKNGLVDFEQSVENGRVKNTYTITPEGRQAFSEWLENGAGIQKVKEEFLLKIFFFSELPEEKRKHQIGEYVSRLAERVEKLTSMKEGLQDHNVDAFMMKTLEFGIDYHSFLKEWHQRFLSSMTSEKDP